MFLKEDAKRIIDLLNNASFKAYAVGGCVRDSIMGRDISDYDITTSALPGQTEAVLSENSIKYIETGIKHGTITAIINHIPYEITTFRTDGKYSDNRHPESVDFVLEVKDDLSRRDFTVNAIAYNDKEGYIDLFGGIGDINNKVIRTVGNSGERFREDALRIMRALRFSSQLCFTIEENTKKAIFENKELLKNIAVERIRAELLKLLLGDNCDNVLKEYIEVIRVVIPEARAVSLSDLPKKDYIRFAYLLDDKSDYEKALKRLKVSNEFFNMVKLIIENKDVQINSDRPTLKRLLGVMGEELLFDLLKIKNLPDEEKLLQDIINNKEPYKISDLAINGFDLMKLGFQGKEISDMLDTLLDEVINNPSLNNRETLLKMSKRMINL